MKTTFILDIQKKKEDYTSLIVTGRRGDLASNSVDVLITNNGEPYPLTNLTVFYECVKPDDTVVRDKEGVNIIDAARGHFAYTFPAEVFSVPGQIKRSFFSIEKEKIFRATTQDFSVLTLCDALTDNIESKLYISEFDQALEMVKGHRKEIDEANQKIAGLTPYIQTKIDETDKKSKEVTARIQIRVDGVSKQIDAMDIVKKTGDTITGLLEYKSDNAFVLGSRSYKTIFHKGAQGELIVAPSTKEQGDTWDWSKKVEIRTDGTMKQATDTDWIPLKTTGVEDVPDRPLKYKKTGGLVTVMGSIRNPKNTVIFATLPEGFRPPQDVAFPVVVVTGSTTAAEFTIQKGGGLFVNGVPANATCHLVASYVV